MSARRPRGPFMVHHNDVSVAIVDEAFGSFATFQIGFFGIEDAKERADRTCAALNAAHYMAIAAEAVLKERTPIVVGPALAEKAAA